MAMAPFNQLFLVVGFLLLVAVSTILNSDPTPPAAEVEPEVSVPEDSNARKRVSPSPTPVQHIVQPTRLPNRHPGVTQGVAVRQGTFASRDEKREAGTKGQVLGNFYTDKSRDVDAYERSRMVFLHHNKAAGLSVRQQLEEAAKRSRKKFLHVPLTQRMLLPADAFKSIDIVAGGYLQGMCEEGEGERDCAYFTMLRQPAERMVSAFCYCFEGDPKDQLCNARYMREEELSLTVANVERFAEMTGNLLMEQLTFDIEEAREAGCSLGEGAYNCMWLMRQRREENERSEGGDWRKRVADSEERRYFEALGVLDRKFAVIGLVSQYGESMEMVEEAFGLPMEKEVHEHQMDCSLDKGTLIRHLTEDGASRYFAYDTRLYERAEDIFRQQQLARLG